jgi:chromosome segregation protein
MGLRRSSAERELSKLAAAYERATKALDEAEQVLRAAESERNAEHERLAADAYLDDSPEAARLNGKVERNVAEAIARRDNVSAAVRGLTARASELAATVAHDQHKAAEKALTDAVTARTEAEQLLAKRREEALAARQALTRAEGTLRRPDRLWSAEAQESLRAAEQSHAAWLATQPAPAWEIATPEEREAAERYRERQVAEDERRAAEYRERVLAGEVPGIRLAAEPTSERSLRPGERFPRLT